MDPINVDVERSFRRSRKREQVLIMLSSMGEAHPRKLAFACGMEWRRLRAVMHGQLPSYRVEMALVPLGLAEVISTPNGHAYRITNKGRKRARQYTSRRLRAQAARRAAAEASGRQASPQVPVHPPKEKPAPARAPEATWSVTWSFT